MACLGNKGVKLAPHIGHVLNSYHRFGAVIEPVNVYCFRTDPCEALAEVYGGYPIWTHLELAKGD
jgi:hypothetical protein